MLLKDSYHINFVIACCIHLLIRDVSLLDMTNRSLRLKIVQNIAEWSFLEFEACEKLKVTVYIRPTSSIICNSIYRLVGPLGLIIAFLSLLLQDRPRFIFGFSFLLLKSIWCIGFYFINSRLKCMCILYILLIDILYFTFSELFD
ncbi:hypothetical protein BDA99DRAFT_509868 [Phascolomyces articulosus]|uniref:Uncharacterized protein n=1 Tax=Phascolomyces articulosus TaxID=60185 RepID=A0AAD5KAQ5_9FUNG|nr:hypothetical protein BDA99DRAFT_509868 [Phascolomyces articulosus]